MDRGHYPEKFFGSIMRDISAFADLVVSSRMAIEQELFPKQFQNSADLLVLAIALFLLLGAGDSYSATSIGVLIIGATILLLLHRRKNLARFVGRYLRAFVLFFIALFLLFYESILSVVTAILGRDETLTGRTDIWRTLIDFASLNPILGVGYGGFYAPGNLELEHYFGKEFILAQAHSGYLAVYVELGILGLILLGVFFLAYCGKVQKGIKSFIRVGGFGNMSCANVDSL